MIQRYARPPGDCGSRYGSTYTPADDDNAVEVTVYVTLGVPRLKLQRKGPFVVVSGVRWLRGWVTAVPRVVIAAVVPAVPAGAVPPRIVVAVAAVITAGHEDTHAARRGRRCGPTRHRGPNRRSAVARTCVRRYAVGAAAWSAVRTVGTFADRNATHVP